MEEKEKKEKEVKEEKKESKKDEKKVADLEKELEEANKKSYDLNDKYLRVLAEYDNFKKRTAKEREQIYSDAYANAVKEMLPIIDNIERSLTFAKEGEIADGLKLIIASIGDTLKKMGVTEIETKTFDPNLHNAVMHVEDENLGEGEIVEVFQKGYQIGEKVIRFAMVKVAN